MAAERYDLVVIGAGSAGLTAARFGIGIGKKVALIEKDKIGGECTWTGCVPSKALIKTAEVAHLAKHATDYGLYFAEGSAMNTSNVMDHVRKVIEEVYRTETPQEIEKTGIRVIYGDPKFVDHYTIAVYDRIIKAKRFIIATGSSPFVPPIEGLENVSYLTNNSLFELKTLPASMLILGGGPIGIEMASALSRLGVKVTIVEMQDRILPREDEELVHLLTEQFESDGIILRTGFKAIKAQQHDHLVHLTCEGEGGIVELAAERILVAVGRKPNIEGLGLEGVGVRTSGKGIEVNGKMQTAAKYIYAAGDVVGPYLFSHMAWQQGMIAARNALLPFYKKISYDNVVWVTFTAPELATAGLTEAQAREKYGDSICVYKVRYKDLDRAVCDRAMTGLCKFICTKRGKLIGAHILGARAGEIIGEVQVGRRYGYKLRDFYPIIHPYPTYSELIWKAGKMAYVDSIKNCFVVRLAQWLYSKFKRKGS